MNVHVWTASHVGNPIRIQTLRQTLESIALIVKPDHYWLSVSGSVAKDDVQKILEIAFASCDTKTHLLYQPEPYKQFQHLRAIHDAVLLSQTPGEDFIVFCDDDDLFLQWFEKKQLQDLDVLKSLQYIPCETDDVAQTENADVRVVLRLKEGRGSRWAADSDFSGYGAKLALVSAYFRKEQERKTCVIPSMEDLTFMDYLDNAKNVGKTEEPYMFRRIIENRGLSWKEQVSGEVADELRGQIARVKNILDKQ
jgi:hypothetical protein